MPAGWVYILTNDAFPHLLKVGKTATSPAQRASELNATGVPDDFVVLFAALSPDIDRHESDAHRLLAQYRYRDNREFFAVDRDTATLVVRRVCGVGDIETVTALKVELEILQAECAKLRSQVDSSKARVEELERKCRREEELSERLDVEQSIAKHQRNLADARRQLLDEALSREVELTQRVSALTSDVATLRILLADAVRDRTEGV